MSWFVTILFLCLTFTDVSGARRLKSVPSAVVVGTVYCDTCFQEDVSETSHFISGATVAVECKDGGSKLRFRKEVETDKKGEFKVPLPLSVAKDVNRIEHCSVKLVQSSEPYCAVASRATSSLLHLESRKQGTHVFSAGFFSFKPLEQPSLCTQVFKSLKKTSLLPSLEHPSLPNPFENLPSLPHFPDLPPFPQLPPATRKTAENFPSQKFFSPFLPPLIPNPFQPPPLIPNPFQPPPLIPNPFQPPPSPLLPLPPIPGLTPSPPPPLIPLPPLPLVPLPPVPSLVPPPPPPPPPSFPVPLPPLPHIPGIPSPPPPWQTSP